MKLKKEFIVHDVSGEHLLVPTGASAFKGIVKSNDTAAFIIGQLTKETSEEKIVNALCSEYDVTQEKASADVDRVLKSLLEIGAIE